ncbi:DinB family protein [Priestia filamentosa]|uniref:DinB family protein n=1 Tax=Priestia filamentosa TaxID=1402861 RepID=UPI00397955A5
MTNFPLQFYQFNTWANEQIFKRLKELPEETYRKEIQSIFPSLSHVLTHIYLSDLGWFDVFLGKDLLHALNLAKEHKEEMEAKSLAEMEQLFTDLSERYKTFLSKEENLPKQLSIQNPAGGVMETTVGDLVPHVVNHGTYHRGNISAMLRQMGHSSVPTDYGMYLFLFAQKEKSSFT